MELAWDTVWKRLVAAAGAFLGAGLLGVLVGGYTGSSAAGVVALGPGLAGVLCWYRAASAVGPAVLSGLSVVAAVHLMFAGTLAPRGWLEPVTVDEPPNTALLWWALLVPVGIMGAWLVPVWRRYRWDAGNGYSTVEVLAGAEWRRVWYRWTMGVAGLLVAAAWGGFGSAVAGEPRSMLAGFAIAGAAVWAASSAAFRAGVIGGLAVFVAALTLFFSGVYGPRMLWLAAHGTVVACKVETADSDTDRNRRGTVTTRYTYELRCPEGRPTLKSDESYRVGEDAPVVVDRTGLVRPVMRDELVSPAARTWLWILLIAPWTVLAGWTVTAVRRRGRVLAGV
ncbi:hypothetical protein ACFFX1_27730 [Dactylosporangium sucinum]|uniref:Uncharacterized protein n=1 Tax=Dactylosporangium sucinum TaxID=1424081 RepID=A0A917UF12_9ACTN|nr:hypothetical protein [Dactylosporangium sucinum]GGM84418.1 hypothetical protein GCM10007977_102450 [Dactylosporangium sucinum]